MTCLLSKVSCLLFRIYLKSYFMSISHNVRLINRKASLALLPSLSRLSVESNQLDLVSPNLHLLSIDLILVNSLQVRRSKIECLDYLFDCLSLKVKVILR